MLNSKSVILTTKQPICYNIPQKIPKGDHHLYVTKELYTREGEEEVYSRFQFSMNNTQIQTDSQPARHRKKVKKTEKNFWEERTERIVVTFV